MIFALALAAATPLAARVDAVAVGANLAGVVLVAKGDTVLVEKGYGTVTPGGKARHDPRSRWRLASITKQVTAALLMRGYSSRLDMQLSTTLDMPSLGSLSLRQLLTHHSGLPNPDNTPPGPGGMPSFYQAQRFDLTYCLSAPAVPGSAFAYNNCDYLIAGAALFGDLDKIDDAWPTGMKMARQGDVGIPGYIGDKPEPTFNLATFGPAGGLIGTAHDVFAFDRSLMTGTLLTAAQREEMWKPEGGNSYQALGQWVFPGQLKGCAASKRIVQRDGEIGGVQTRNYILPDDDLVVIVFTNRSSDDFKIGEVWQGSGFAYDLLSTAACA